MSDIRVVVDDQLKSKAEAVLDKLDLTMSQAVRMLLRHLVKTEELPFNPFEKEFNEETSMPIKRSYEEKNLISYKNPKEMFASWNEEKD